jgi:L-lactate dehydrogenase complex protein LldF
MAGHGSPPEGLSRGRALPTFQSSAPGALSDEQLRRNLKKATTTIRGKRANVAGEMPDWEALRTTAGAVKRDVLNNLDEYLDQLEERVSQAGGVIHRARDGVEATSIVGRLVKEAKAREVVKVKSITTDEVGLNEALSAQGIRPIETDLAELIIQLADERSSHFLVPAIHKNRTQIRDLFRVSLNRPNLSDDPQELAEAARLHLRKEFMDAEVAVSGANFAIAETGTVGVVESEGNGRMCLTLPKLLITLMGIEKVLPTFRDLEVFLQLLPRSATGERMNPYTTLWTGVSPGDGPEEFHLILLDNGRRRVLADPVGREALHCIRCSACLNICPIYERVGGHAYNATYPGPIGSILTPQLLGPGVHDSLPFASTLCGACADVCPVGIDIPRVLLHLRGKAVAKGPSLVSKALRGAKGTPFQERWLMRALGWVLRSPWRYRRALRVGRRVQKRFVRDGWMEDLPGYGRGWTLGRDLQSLPEESFREWWARERGRGEVGESRHREDGSRVGVHGASEGIGEDVRENAGMDSSIPREYRRKGTLSRDQILSLFVDRVSDYQATVTRTDEAGLPGAVAAALEAQGTRRMAIPLDLPESWIEGLPDGFLQLLRDGEGEGGQAFSKGQLASCHGVITGCAKAVAETGTILLDSGATQGRRILSLLPDYHLCVIFEKQVVETVSEGLDAVFGAVRDERRPVTLISGPSATSDIELIRVEGVHGPRNLEVILVEETP